MFQDQPDSRKASGIKFDRIRKTFSQVKTPKEEINRIPGFLNDSQRKRSAYRRNSIFAAGLVWNPGIRLIFRLAAPSTPFELAKCLGALIPDSEFRIRGFPHA